MHRETSHSIPGAAGLLTASRHRPEDDEHPALTLQRAMGNRAAADLLDGQRSTKEPVVRRLVRWDASKTPNVIASITLDRLSGTGGGAHSTSYQLFLETVQNAVINTDFAQAVGRLNAL